MRFDFVGWTKDDISAAAIGLPSRNARREVFVRVRNTAIVLFFEFVLCGVWSWIAARPECFDELISLFIVRELLECTPLFVGDDPTNVFIKPLLVRLAELLLQRLGILDRKSVV